MVMMVMVMVMVDNGDVLNCFFPMRIIMNIGSIVHLFIVSCSSNDDAIIPSFTTILIRCIVVMVLCLAMVLMS